VQDMLLTVHAVRDFHDPGHPLGRGCSRSPAAGAAGRPRSRSGPSMRPMVADAVDFYPQLSERRALGAAIARLPAGQRRAIQLFKLRELSLKEAALERGLSIAALKVASHRALKALRAMLDERA
jgi:DNA-directed RNA polymerase specialized sigma24 family protein